MDPQMTTTVEQAIYPYEVLKAWGKIFCNRGNKFFCYFTGQGGKRISILMVLAMFARDDSFKPYFQTYMNDPDVGVVYDTTTFNSQFLPGNELVDQVDFQNHSSTYTAKLESVYAKFFDDELFKKGYTNKTLDNHDKMDEVDRDFVCLMIALCGVKRFSETKSDEFDNYVKQRMGRFYIMVNAEEKNCDDMRQQIDNEFATFSTGFLFYPKLKKIIYSYILSHDGKIGEYFKVIIDNSPSSIFNIIHAFIKTPTKAHLSLILRDEINRWYRTYKVLEEEYGDLLPYVKILNPGDKRINARNWPTLAKVSLLYKCYKEGGEYLQGYNIRLPEALLRDLATLIKPEYLVSPDALEGRQKMCTIVDEVVLSEIDDLFQK